MSTLGGLPDPALATVIPADIQHCFHGLAQSCVCALQACAVHTPSVLWELLLLHKAQDSAWTAGREAEGHVCPEIHSSSIVTTFLLGQLLLCWTHWYPLITPVSGDPCPS